MDGDADGHSPRKDPVVAGVPRAEKELEVAGGLTCLSARAQPPIVLASRGFYRAWLIPSLASLLLTSKRAYLDEAENHSAEQVA